MRSCMIVCLVVVVYGCLNVESGKIPNEFQIQQLDSGPCIGRGESCLTAPESCCDGLECDGETWICGGCAQRSMSCDDNNPCCEGLHCYRPHFWDSYYCYPNEEYPIV